MAPIHLDGGLPFHPSAPDRRKSGKSGKTEKKRKLSFSRLLKEPDSPETAAAAGTGTVPEREELSAILDEVFSRGEALKGSPTMDRIKDYRQSIRRFFQLVSREAVEMEAAAGIRNPKTLEQKQYYVIRTVDSKLDDLARAVLQEQRDAVSVLGRVDEINSLLVDLLH